MRASTADKQANGFAAGQSGGDAEYLFSPSLLLCGKSEVFNEASPSSDGGDDALNHAGMKKAEPHAAAPPGEWTKITGELP